MTSARPSDSHDSSGSHDAREESGDPLRDPAALGETQAEQPDADGGSAPSGGGGTGSPAGA